MKSNKYFKIISETILKPYFEGNIKSRGAEYVWHMKNKYVAHQAIL